MENILTLILAFAFGFMAFNIVKMSKTHKRKIKRLEENLEDTREILEKTRQDINYVVKEFFVEDYFVANNYPNVAGHSMTLKSDAVKFEIIIKHIPIGFLSLRRETLETVYTSKENAKTFESLIKKFNK